MFYTKHREDNGIIIEHSSGPLSQTAGVKSGQPEAWWPISLHIVPVDPEAGENWRVGKGIINTTGYVRPL